MCNQPSLVNQDWELDGVPLLATLRCVSLRGCEGLTDDGIAQLAALPRLARLVRSAVVFMDVMRFNRLQPSKLWRVALLVSFDRTTLSTVDLCRLLRRVQAVLPRFPAHHTHCSLPPCRCCATVSS